jgi:magnesium transporter
VGGAHYETRPLSVFVSGRRIVTVAPQPADFIQPLLDGKVAGLSVQDQTGFILRLLWQLADEYLACVRDINAAVDGLEERLRRSVNNEEVMGLLDYQKSLTYFTTAMRANELVLDRMQKLPSLEWTEDDRDLLEDLQIEMRQAIEMVDISDNILAQTMDAFASIVSNNLGATMKVLTSVTILLAIPTLVASLYGMNIALPGAHSPYAFVGIVLLSVATCIGLIVLFRRWNWL